MLVEGVLGEQAEDECRPGAALGPPAAFCRELAHGQHLDQVVWDEGWSLDRPLEAIRRGQDLVLRVLIRERDEADRPQHRPAGPGSSGVDAVPRQRVAAYAVATSVRGLLATQFSHTTGAAGLWGLPGGGLEPDEEPVDAVRREVYEETAQVIDVHGLALVQTSHWIGPSPRGVIEDFHAVRLVYRASVSEPTDVRVLDVGGTTSEARWIALDAWPQLDWTSGARVILAEMLGTDALSAPH